MALLSHSESFPIFDAASLPLPAFNRIFNTDKFFQHQQHPKNQVFQTRNTRSIDVAGITITKTCAIILICSSRAFSIPLQGYVEHVDSLRMNSRFFAFEKPKEKIHGFCYRTRKHLDCLPNNAKRQHLILLEYDFQIIRYPHLFCCLFYGCDSLML